MQNLVQFSKKDYEKLFENSPELLSAKDLVSIGLFNSQVSVHKGKDRNTAPPHIYISERKVRFPKNGLIAWLAAKQDHSE